MKNTLKQMTPPRQKSLITTELSLSGNTTTFITQKLKSARVHSKKHQAKVMKRWSHSATDPCFTSLL